MIEILFSLLHESVLVCFCRGTLSGKCQMKRHTGFCIFQVPSVLAFEKQATIVLVSPELFLS